MLPALGVLIRPVVGRQAAHRLVRFVHGRMGALGPEIIPATVSAALPQQLLHHDEAHFAPRELDPFGGPPCPTLGRDPAALVDGEMLAVLHLEAVRLLRLDGMVEATQERRAA